MDFYAFSGLANGLISTTLGLFFFLRSPHNPKHQAYGLYCLSLSIWSYFYFAWQVADSPERALLFVRLLMAGAILIPATYLHHVLTLLDIEKEHKFALKLGYALSGFFLLSDLTPYFVADLKPEMSFPYWPKPGILFHFYLAWFGGFTVYAVSFIAKAFYRAKGSQRDQYLYLIIGAIIGYGGGGTNFLLWYGIQIPPTGNILVLAYAVIVGYTLARYRLLGLSEALESALTYLLLIVSVMLLAYPILLMTQKAYFGTVNYHFSVVLLLLLSVLVVGAYHMRQHAQRAVALTFFTSRYKVHDTLSEFSKALVTNLDLKSLTEEIVRTLVKVIGIQTASLYVLNKEKEEFELVCSHGLSAGNAASLSLQTQSNLRHYLERHGDIVVREELQQVLPRTHRTESVLETMETMNSEVCIPFINKESLIGFCNLGARSNFRMFSPKDLALLDTLARNAAIALDNALLYEDLRTQKALMQRTDRLRSLETIAGGFAHEIRNPLTSIKTFVQLTPTRKDDPEFINSFSPVVLEDIARIERLIQEIFDYAKYMEPQFKEENVNEVVESCLYFIEVKATHRSVQVEKQFAPDLPPVMLDRQQIKQVLMNLFLNALQAIGDTGGRLIVRSHRLAKDTGVPWVQIQVADTGGGIAPADLEHIFDPFYTTKHASEEREGTGLGLTIVHQIIEEHGGTIEVQSEAGRGTTFFVNLPTKRENPAAKRRKKK
jgi:two-component system, NtrC family, sensor kinase